MKKKNNRSRFAWCLCVCVVSCFQFNEEKKCQKLDIILAGSLFSSTGTASMYAITFLRCFAFQKNLLIIIIIIIKKKRERNGQPIQENKRKTNEKKKI